MKQHWLLNELCAFQSFPKLPDIVAVKGAVVCETEIFKNSGIIKKLIYILFDMTENR